MLLDPKEPLTSAEVFSSTLVFGLLACLLSIPLILMQPQTLFGESWLPLITASTVFWGIVSMLAFKYFWRSYYEYFYPPWVRRLSPLNLITYGLMTLGMWILVKRFALNYVMYFLVLGGFEGIAEHIIGIYGMGILEKVPWLKGLDPLPIFVFSFFEYVFYWSLVVWLALAFQTIMQAFS